MDVSVAHMTEPTSHDAAAQWPTSLHIITQTLARLPFPCAVFWGDDLFLWHNQPWKEHSGEYADQGRPYRDSLPTGIVQEFEHVRNGVSHGDVQSHFFSKSPGKDATDDHISILSALPEPDPNKVKAILVQLFPKSHRPPLTQRASYDKAKEQAADLHPEEIPLDEHPFFHRFAEMLPIGLAILDHNAEAVFVNKQFYELTTHVDEDKSFKAWPNSIYHEDHDRVINAYQDVFNSQQEMRTEYRTTKEGSLWRLLLLTPLGDENLRHVSLRKHGGFICCVVDITSEKSAEMTQRKSAKEAQERKEQQERFIDMISHEIRNPLSAILHCAEDILEIAKGDNYGSETAESLVDAADTIILCTTHQKHIVDDVLSFSKLDSSMLSLSPRSVQTKPAIAKTIKMFQPEIRKHEIQYEYKVDVSYDDNKIDWVMADLRRVSQVIINLLSNAIKFTAKKDGERKITIALGVSPERPTSYPPKVVFFDPDVKAHHLDATRSSEWGNGEECYIMIAIIDTGIGISDQNQKKLFQRFRQATPKTEEKYGGSGLGLNISRKLCQLHGGDIGVSSMEGEGSTFGFFFKVRRSSRPGKEPSDGDDDLDMEDMFHQISDLGHKVSKQVERENMPEKLKNPNVERVAEAAPGQATNAQHQHTAEIAADVPTPQDEADEASKFEQSPCDRGEVEMRPKSGGADPDGTTKPKPDQSTNVTRKQEDHNGTSKQHVLIVEDNLINQKILARKLATKGYQVTTANNGREAVEAMTRSVSPRATDDTNTQRDFDCILMDQEMPVMDGNEASRAIRKLEKEEKIKHIPILGVSANVRREQVDEMISAGMDDVIHKPYRIEEIIERIKSITC